MNPKIIKAMIISIAVLLVGGISSLVKTHLVIHDPEKEIVVNIPPSTEKIMVKPPIKRILVHVSGAVYNPGLYEFSEKVRVSEVIQAAGGNLPTADLDQINLANRVSDGSKLHIPIRQTRQKGQPVPAFSAASKVNINTATKSQLEKIPGIGPSTAKRILAQRQLSNGFNTVKDLLKVKGIGPKKLKKIQPHIVCE